MSRVSVLEQLMSKNRRTALDFDYDALAAPLISMMFTPNDIKELERIATSVRYSANIKKKYELIDNIMKSRGFVRAHAGTNRLMYHCLNDGSIGVKVAVDSVGMRDSPREYVNQHFFKPFCSKIFEVTPSGVLAVIERVNPISSIEEFKSVANDIFNLMVTKIIGKYVVDDLGTKSFMNFGLRQNSYGVAFGPVIIDFPYVYEIDGAKLFCNANIIDPSTGQKIKCNGEIDYKPGFNGLYCTKCGKEYKAMDLAKNDNRVRFYFEDDDDQLVSNIIHCFRARVVDGNRVLYDSGHKSKRYLTKGEFEQMSFIENEPGKEYDVDITVHRRSKPMKELRKQYYSELQLQYYNELVKKNPTMLDVTNDSEEKYVDVTETRKRDRIDSTHNIINTPEEESVNNREEVEVYSIEGSDDDVLAASYIPNSNLLEELEKETFPELYLSKSEDIDVVDTEIVNEDSDILEDLSALSNNDEDKEIVVEPTNPTVTSLDLFDDNQNKPVEVYATDESKIEPIVPDERVKAAAEYVAHKDDEEEELDESEYIIDPEQDKNRPDLSPMTRPYAAKPNENVSVYNKIVPNLDFMLNSKNDRMPDLIDNPFIAQPSEKEQVRSDRKVKHSKDNGGYE